MGIKAVFAVIFLATAAVRAKSLPKHPPYCPPFTRGTFDVQQYQLYPENADWDVSRCLIFFGSLFNASVPVYDPYKGQVVDIIEFPGITHNLSLTLGGVAIDPYTRMLSVPVDSVNSYDTSGANTSGDTFLIKYNPDTRSTIWKLNMTTVTQGKYGGFQDVEHDRRGNIYAVATLGSVILRADGTGSTLIPWYEPAEIVSTRFGFAGLASTGDILLVNDMTAGEVFRFDMRAERGTPVLVPRTPNITLGPTDAIYFPPKYGGKVLLVTENFKGTTVLRSRDGWRTAEHLGTVPVNMTAAPGAINTAPLQIGDSLFTLEGYFSDPPLPGSNSGNRTSFPLVDLTTQVEALLCE
ncbi:hypothetical protein DL95DRAFT_509930 [Leptodontidium sp. 2 PMI_412]|nr:hypothetical protein DL95DRAFT_509930 [Leptodontidium sp. 2 PMI_412]